MPSPDGGPSHDAIIDVKQVAEGVGLPPVWVCRYPACPDDRFWISPEIGDYIYEDGDAVDLTDPQTAFGVALKLDEWEMRGPAAGHPAESWVHRIAREALVGGGPPDVTGAMIARLSHIGMDHIIRRSMGREVQPGALATLTLQRGFWSLADGVLLIEWEAATGRLLGSAKVTGWRMSISALVGITDPTEALRVVYEAVTETKPKWSDGNWEAVPTEDDDGIGVEFESGKGAT